MAPAILLYLAVAALALFLPESRFPEDLYSVRRHGEAFSFVYVSALLTLWTLALAPWVVVVYRRGAKVDPKILAVPVLLVCAAAVWVRPPFTHDIYVYVCQGRQLTAYGVSPYHVNLWPFQSDAVIGAADNTWFNLTSLFGPLALAAFAAANILSPVPTLHAIGRTLKVLWLVPYVVFAAILWRRWKGSPHRPAIMLAIFANPAMLSMVVIEGHLEIFMLVFVVSAGLALEQRRDVIAAIALCGAACVKISAIVVLPICACWLWRRDKVRGARFFFLFLLAYGLIYGLLAGGEWSEILRFSRGWSDPRWHNCIPQLVFFTGVDSLPLVRHVSDGCFYLAVAALCLANLTGRIRESIFFSMALTLAALYLTRTYTQPWYTLWFWPLLWLSDSKSKTLLQSITLWTVAVLFTTLKLHVWIAAPWVVLTALLVDVLWLRSRPDVVLLPEERSGEGAAPL